jgi:glyoxylase-like metal-dependent hydrolase (beta-lactamase superfamily II)
MTEIFPTIFQLPEVIIDNRVSVCGYLLKHNKGDVLIGSVTYPEKAFIAAYHLATDFHGDLVAHVETPGDLADIDIVPCPGLTASSRCILYRHQGKNILFTGDTLYNSYGNWQVQLNVEGSSRNDMIHSLQRLKELEVDIAISNTSINHVKYEELAPGRWQTIVNDCIRRLEAGYYQ